MISIKDNWISKLSSVLNKRITLFSLFSFDILFCVINIYKQIFIIGSLFLFINLFALLFFEKKKVFYLLFFLYPLARVLKLPGFNTSLLTVTLICSYLILFIRFLTNREKIDSFKILAMGFFVFYTIFTFFVSIINGGFQWNDLLSYYVYLAFPFITFLFTYSFKDINGTNNIILCMISYLAGMLITIAFYKIIPNGASMLKNIGVNIFDMGVYGVRLTPLTDDPNYGAALIVLLSGIYIISKKTRKQLYVGYPVLILCISLTCLSISKMFIICILIYLCCTICLIVKKINNTLLSILIVVIAIFCFLIFLSTSFGNLVLVRIIGTRDGISLNRITSGRAELFGAYSSYILSNPMVVLFGKGPVYANNLLFSTGEHNTFTKNIFGSGLVGVSLLLAAFYIMIKNRFDCVKAFPSSVFFISFMACLFLCFMSLCIAPSTVFPIFVVSLQFSNLNRRNKPELVEINI